MIPEAVFLVSKIRNIPYVAHIHADVEPSGKTGFLLPFYKKIFYRMYKLNIFLLKKG